MLWLVLLKIKLAFMAFAKRFAYDFVSFFSMSTTAASTAFYFTNLHGDLFLVFAREVHEMIVFRSDEQGDRRFVEPTPLSVPLFDRIKRALPREVEHEKYSNCVIANEGQHVDELSLAAEVPDRESDFGISNRDRLLHEVNACG